MKKLFIIPLIFALSSCASSNQSLVRTEYKVVKPSEALYECPIQKRWPNPETLTDVEVAKTLVQLYKNNVKCKTSIEAIRKFLDRADRRIQGTPDPAEQPANTGFLGLF